MKHVFRTIEFSDGSFNIQKRVLFFFWVWYKERIFQKTFGGLLYRKKEIVEYKTLEDAEETINFVTQAISESNGHRIVPCQVAYLSGEHENALVDLSVHRYSFGEDDDVYPIWEKTNDGIQVKILMEAPTKLKVHNMKK